MHSIELTKGVHRETVRLIARTATLIANKRSLRRYGLIQGLAPFTASSTFFGVTPDIALDAYTHSVSQLEADLGRWTLNESVGDQRTRIGSLAYWHMCRILLRKYIQDLPMEDPDCQSSAKAILELCVEAGDKIEFLNWVSAAHTSASGRGGTSLIAASARRELYNTRRDDAGSKPSGH